MNIDTYSGNITSSLHIATLNVRGLGGKLEEILHVLNIYNIDILFICETWSPTYAKPPHPCCISLSPHPQKHTQTSGHNHYGTAFFIHPKWLHYRNIFKIHKSEHPGLIASISVFDLYLCGVYLPPSMDTPECIHIINTQISKKPPTTKHGLVVGDFNMRLGQETGDHYKNSRGYALPHHLEDLGLIRYDMPYSTPTYFNGPNNWSIIDYIYSMGTYINGTVSIYDSYNVGGTDHNIVSIKISLPQHNYIPTKKRYTFNLNKLHNENVLKCYNDLLKSYLESKVYDSITNCNIEDLDNHITFCIDHAAQIVLGKTCHNRYKSPFVTNELRAARRERQKRYLRMRNSKTEEGREFFWLQFKKARAVEKREVKCSVRKSFTIYTEKLKSGTKAAQQRLIARLLKGRKANPCTSLTPDKTTLDKTYTYFSQLYTPQTPASVSPRGTYVHNTCLLSPPFTEDQVYQAVSEIPKNKAPGPLGLPGELFQAAAGTLKRYIYMLFTLVWNEQTCPISWCKSVICPIFKKGDPEDPSNYRPICLSEVLRKCFEKCILQALQTNLGEPDSRQGGFRKKRGTIDQIACLDTAIKRRTKIFHKPPCVVFLDIKAAYDSVDRLTLWSILSKKIPIHLVKILQCLFDYNYSRVLVCTNTTDEFHHQTGLLQGSILSPLLYSFYIDGLPAAITQQNNKGTTGVCEAFLYADDIALITNTRTDMQHYLKICEDHAAQHNYKFAPQKCVVLQDPSNQQELYLHNEKLSSATTFSYLGMTVGRQGLLQQAHATKQATEMTRKLFLLRSIGFNGNGLGMETLRMIYLTFLRPILEYGLPLLTNKTSLETLQKAQNFALRMMTSAPRGTNSRTLHVYLGIPKIGTRHLGLRTRWLHKVALAGSEYLVSRYSLYTIRKNIFDPKLNNLATGELPELQDIHGIVRRFYKQEAEQENKSEQEQHPLSKNMKQLLEDLDRFADRKIAKRVFLWIIRRPFGHPRKCTKCDHAYPNCEHFQKCVDIQVDKLINQRRWQEAAEQLRNIAMLCMKWQLPKNTEWKPKPNHAQDTSKENNKPKGTHPKKKKVGWWMQEWPSKPPDDSSTS
jgi:hypothetical protein